MDDVDSRRIEEVTYLNTENTWRYRAIVHFCFRRHEHMQAYIYPEAIWQALQKQPQFKDYTQEQMDQDLSQLVAWHNLQAFQETGRALSIVDFKRKMLRYQCTPYTVEIERLVEKLKKIGNEFGGSLETTQFDRIRDSLEKLLQYEQADDKELYQNWQDFLTAGKIVQSVGAGAGTGPVFASGRPSGRDSGHGGGVFPERMPR